MNSGMACGLALYQAAGAMGMEPDGHVLFRPCHSVGWDDEIQFHAFYINDLLLCPNRCRFFVCSGFFLPALALHRPPFSRACSCCFGHPISMGGAMTVMHYRFFLLPYLLSMLRRKEVEMRRMYEFNVYRSVHDHNRKNKLEYSYIFFAVVVHSVILLLFKNCLRRGYNHFLLEMRQRVFSIIVWNTLFFYLFVVAVVVGWHKKCLMMTHGRRQIHSHSRHRLQILGVHPLLILHGV